MPKPVLKMTVIKRVQGIRMPVTKQAPAMEQAPEKERVPQKGRTPEMMMKWAPVTEQMMKVIQVPAE